MKSGFVFREMKQFTEQAPSSRRSIVHLTRRFLPVDNRLFSSPRLLSNGSYWSRGLSNDAAAGGTYIEVVCRNVSAVTVVVFSFSNPAEISGSSRPPRTD